MVKDAAPTPLSRFRAHLAQPVGLRRIDDLLSAPNPAQAVAALAPTEIYYLVKDVGFADAGDLMALATGEQVQGCLDLDVWDRDHVQLEAARPWLASLIEAGFEKVGEVWARLDQELTALLIARSTTIYDLSMGEEPDDSDDLPIYLTPDTFFAVKLRDPNDEDAELVQRLIEDLYRADMIVARHTLMAARSEFESHLEEESYRFRSARMADLGYVDFHEALEVFRPLDPETVVIDEGTAGLIDPDGDSVLPAPMLGRFEHLPFLAESLDRIDDDETLRRVELALTVLTNKVLAAARTRPGDEEAMRVGADHALSTLSLGLESISRGNPAVAANALQTVSVTRLHRVGYTLTLRLARFALAIAPRATTAGDPDDALMAALGGRRPWFPSELDGRGGVGPRPFASVEDLRTVATRLTRLALRVAIAEQLGVELLGMGEYPEPRPVLDDHVRTALCRAMIGGALAAGALTLTELEQVRAQAFANGVLVSSAWEQAVTALTSALDSAGVTAARMHLDPLLHGWANDLVASLGSITTTGPIEVRYIDGILIAQGQA